MTVLHETARIVGNEEVGPRLYVMSVCAFGIAHAIEPGQFVHMRIPGMDDHILRRPFSVYARDRASGIVEILYQVVGYGTERMTKLLAGDVADVMGPVGHGWQVPDGTRRALLVAGGVGAAPLYMLSKRLRKLAVDTTVILGAQTKAALVCRDRYEKTLGAPPRCSTDDGSFGRAGFATSLVQEALAEGGWDVVYVCGPEPLMRIVANLAADAGVACQVSLERRMACGIGACLSCVVDTTGGRKRACVDGPVFDAAEVVW